MDSKAKYRSSARQHLKAAQHELETEDSEREVYAALRLRMAIESLVYEKAESYRDHLPPDLLKQWQPRKLLRALVELDPFADQSATLTITPTSKAHGDEKPMVFTEVALSLADVKQHYDALGHFLHEQWPNTQRRSIRQRLFDISLVIDGVLSSQAWNFRINLSSGLKCSRCGAETSALTNKLERKHKAHVNCFNCGAPYVITKLPEGGYYWQEDKFEAECYPPGCGHKFFIWRDQMEEGQRVDCAFCGRKHLVVTAIVALDQIESDKST